MPQGSGLEGSESHQLTAWRPWRPPWRSGMGVEALPPSELRVTALNLLDNILVVMMIVLMLMPRLIIDALLITIYSFSNCSNEWARQG